MIKAFEVSLDRYEYNGIHYRARTGGIQLPTEGALKCGPSVVLFRKTLTACKRAGIVGVTFNDLRGTAVTRLAIAGCTEPEIATITGHSLRDVRSILDAHYLHRDPALAESAIKYR